MLEFGMPSDSPTCGPVATRRMQVSSTSARRGSYKPTISFIESKNEVAKAPNLQSRCSVSALVSALVTSCVWNPVVEELFLCKSFKVKAYPVIMVIHKRTQYYFEKGERSADTLIRFAKNIAMGGNTADISSLYQSQC
jgi:hypothetical protein